MKTRLLIGLLLLSTAICVGAYAVLPSFKQNSASFTELYTRQVEARSAADIAREETEQARADLEKLRVEYNGETILEIVQTHNEIALKDAEEVRKAAAENRLRRESWNAVLMIIVLAITFVSIFLVCTNLNTCAELIKVYFAQRLYRE